MAETTVVDASPLIFLARLGRLDLLPRLSARLCIPAAVMTEIKAGEVADATAPALVMWAIAYVTPEVAVPATIATWELGLGESQVLAIANGISASEVALDDLAARRCALAHGISVVGTLGLLLRAKKRGLIPAARPLLKQLLDSGMYLEEELIANALAQVGE